VPRERFDHDADEQAGHEPGGRPSDAFAVDLLSEPGCHAGLPSWLVPVAHAELGEQVAGARRVGFQLAPELGHVLAQVVGLVHVLRPPDLEQQLALADQFARVPDQLFEQLPFGRGQVQVYFCFCDPRSPWQRGTNENTNGLLRQYLSKSGDLGQFDQATLDAIAAELNGRPRQTLGFKTPSQAFAEALR